MRQDRKFVVELAHKGVALWIMASILSGGGASAQDAATPAPSDFSGDAGNSSAGIFAPGGHNTKQPITISSNTLEVKQDEEIAIFTGDVDAIQGDMRLRSDSLEVYYATEEGDGTTAPNSIKRIRALGRVFLVSPQETAEGDWADYDVTASVITLHDNVILTRGKNVLCGEVLNMDLNSGRSILSGACKDSGATQSRVQGLFFPDEPDDETNDETQE